MDDIVISLKNVSKYYKLYNSPKDRLKEAFNISNKIYHKRFYATKNLDLEIKKGEILGIVGKNGSGKSTLLKLITKVLTPNEGTVDISGKISALLELGSGFNPEFTGMQNIYFYGTILGYSKEEMNEKLDEIITFAEIGDFIDQPLKTYSSGMKARLGFAVAVHIEPEILILDEVLSVGDVLFKRKSYAKMQEFFENGKTIIYVSHSANEINRLCTRAVFLLNGEIIMDNTPKLVTKYYEKYLFAKKENQEKVIEEINNLTCQTLQSNKELPEAEVEVSLPKEELLVESCDKEDFENTILPSEVVSNIQKAFFIPDFESKNKTEYDNTFLDIYDIWIETLAGEKVNVLITNERYRYCYKLKFKGDFKNVDYGMQIVTEKGVMIAGSKNEQSIPDVKNDDILQVKWEFNCLMHEGIYYANVAVNHPVDGHREYINRVIDAVVFKVLPSENNCNGLIYLQQLPPRTTYLTKDHTKLTTENT
jgi:lipopolysaccharide transport system ATP-binding protein